MVRSALLLACALGLLVAPLAGCSSLTGGPGISASPESTGRTPGTSTPATGTSTTTVTPTQTENPTTTATPTPTSTPAPEPTPTAAPLPVGSADAPGDPDRPGAPARYRAHVAAAGSYRLSSSFVVDAGENRTDRVAALAVRWNGSAIDRIGRADTFRSYDDEPVTARTTTASYRPAAGPHLYYRNGSLRPRPESGTIQGASYRRAVGYPPWEGSDLAVRLAAAVRLSGGQPVRIGGDRATRHRVVGLNRTAYDALGLRERDDLLARVAGSEGEAEYPERVAGTVTLDAADRIRRVNLTLERTRHNESYLPVDRTVEVTARLRTIEDAPAPPAWVERTPSVRFERLPDAGGVAFAVEHVRGPQVRGPSGSLRTGTETSRTEFLLLTRGTLRPGERLYVWVAPRDDENGMEAYTAVGDRPEEPFVSLRVRSLELYATVRHDGRAWDHRHLLVPNATREP